MDTLILWIGNPRNAALWLESRPMKGPGAFLLLSASVLLGGLWYSQGGSERGPRDDAGGTLTLYVAAGIRRPVEALLREYEQAYGVRTQVQYAGSGTLLANLEVARKGDLYIAADESFIRCLNSTSSRMACFTLFQL